MGLRTPPSWLQNGSHPAENDRLTTQAIWRTTGIINATDLQITQNSTPNMTVSVSAGWCAIVGTTQANMGVYMAYNDSAAPVTVTAANPSNPRIDLLCITISDAYYAGTLNQVAFNLIAGTPSGSPVAPGTPANSIALGTIYVGAGVTSILNSNITNTATQATSSIGLSSTGTYTVANFTASTSLTSAGTITQTGTGSVGQLPDAILDLIMGAY
jgi:hypothetical protein